MKKKVITPSIIILLVLIVGFFAYQYWWPPKMEVGMPADIVGWKTYRSEEYGFEIKYSNDWYYTVSDYEDEGQQLICFNPEGVSGDCAAILTANRDSTLQKIYTDEKQMLEKRYAITESVISINGIEGKMLNIGGAIGFSRSFFFEKNGYVYNFTILEGDGDLFGQMLSTFRFIEEKDGTADWKIYKDKEHVFKIRNKEYGFEIKYPSGWSYIANDYEDEKMISFYEGGWKGEGDILLTISVRSLQEEYEKHKDFWNASYKCLSEKCSVEQFYKTPNECKSLCRIEESDTIVDGKNSRVILVKNNQLGFSKQVFIEGGNIEGVDWTIQFSSGVDYEETLDKMLSTFRFLE